MTGQRAAPTSAEELLRLSDVGVRASSGRWIVRHVSLRVRRGEIITIIGPNGGGKTTTMRVAAGVIVPDEGQAWRHPSARVAHAPQRLRVERVLPLSVGRFLTLGTGAKTTDIDAALTRVGCAALRARQMHQLSSGELQRVLIARAILRRPDLLLLDEPVQGVDFAGEAAIYEIIAQLREETGCGVLMVSHDLHFVMKGTDRVVCINGHVCCAGTPKAVSESGEYAALFGDAALRHRAAYAHVHDHRHGLDECVTPPEER